jgi:N-acetylmuramoyl-L-alanine amidase
VAKFIQDELRTNLGNTDRYAKSINGIYILKKAEIPGALVEVGFLSNPSERALLSTVDYQKKLAASIYNGIMRHYTSEEELEDPPG